LQKRLTKDAYEGDSFMHSIFDLSELPAFGAVAEQFYSELAFGVNTTTPNAYVSEGVKFIGHVGPANGINSLSSRFIRAGFDMENNVAVVHKDRILTTRLVFDMVKNLKDEPLAFRDYPRQPTFRGTSMRKILRTENYSLVPSIEYHWPLSFTLNGYLFSDLLIVAREVRKISIDSALWAVGFGVDVHAANKELGRAFGAIGSDGVRLSLSIGLDPLSSKRSKWE